MMAELAVLGGQPQTRRPWPKWPVLGPVGYRLICEVAESGVWAISGRSRGNALQCQLFRSEFGKFTGRNWCVETDHGTTALVAAFEALEIGPGDEVIVPVLTWVACATSVLQVGAVPVLIDVDPESLCVSADAVEAAITERTRAVLVVHLNCTAADIRPLADLARQRDLHLIEDCAQAHGARWRDGRALGADGILATFSMQQGKTLTSGEGGAVVGDDDYLRRRVEAARADGRELRSAVPDKGEMYLDETGILTGANYCLSEFAAAILRDGLRRLPAEAEQRAANADLLDDLLTRRGIRVIKRHEDLEVRPVYEYGIYIEPDVFGSASPDMIREALAAELGLPVYAIDAPLHASPLFQPNTKRRFALAQEACYAPGASFAVAENAFMRLAMIHHAAFLAEPERMEEIAAACDKVIRNRDQIGV